MHYNFFLVTKDKWEFEPPRKDLAAGRGEDCMGNWQELERGEFVRGIIGLNMEIFNCFSLHDTMKTLIGRG